MFAEQTTALGREGYVAGTDNPTLTTGDAPDSICPSGWRLPGSSGNGTYGKLINEYTSTANKTSQAATPLIASPVGFIRSGYTGSGGGTNLSNQGTTGRYRTTGKNLFLNLTTTVSVGGGSSSGPVYGYSLRCLAR